MDITYEGDEDGWTTTAKELCTEILQKQGFKKCAVTIEDVGAKGDNYVATVKRIIAKEENVNNGEPLKMIVKIAPAIEQVRVVMSMEVSFINESVAYQDILPKYNELQERAGIPLRLRFKSPVCYGLTTDPPNETIFLQDLKELDYKILDRFNVLNDVQVRKALQALAKYHSLSFVLRKEDPEFLDSIKKKLMSMWVLTRNIEELKMFLEVFENDTQNLLKTDEHKNLVKGIYTHMGDMLYTLYNADFDSKYSVLTQGDCWTNNIMYKIEDNTPVDIILIDYQQGYFASPVSDLIYFLFICTDYETRKENFILWIDYYYECFNDFLSYFGIKAESVYSREQLDIDFKRNVKARLGQVFILTNLMLRESAEVLDFQNNPSIVEDRNNFGINSMSKYSVNKYTKRIEGVLESCIEFGYI